MAPGAERFVLWRRPVGSRGTTDMAIRTRHVVVVIARIVWRCMRKHGSGPHRGARVANTAIGSRYHVALGLGR